MAHLYEIARYLYQPDIASPQPVFSSGTSGSSGPSGPIVPRGHTTGLVKPTRNAPDRIDVNVLAASIVERMFSGSITFPPLIATSEDFLRVMEFKDNTKVCWSLLCSLRKSIDKEVMRLTLPPDSLVRKKDGFDEEFNFASAVRTSEIEKRTAAVIVLAAKMALRLPVADDPQYDEMSEQDKKWILRVNEIVRDDALEISTDALVLGSWKPKTSPS